jgi:quinol monooxygenase YgiN
MAMPVSSAQGLPRRAGGGLTQSLAAWRPELNIGELNHAVCMMRRAPYAAAIPQPSIGAAPMIHLVAIITAKPGKCEEVLAAFRANMPAVHAEQGCIEYGPAVDAEGGFGAKFGADTFVVIEKWESLEALGAHARSPHMAAYAAKTKDLLANREIHVLSPAV